MMRKVLLLIISALFCTGTFAKDYELKSPDGQVVVVIQVDKKDGIFLNAHFDGKSILQIGPLQMDIEGHGILGTEPGVKKVHRALVEEEMTPHVKEKRKYIKNHYNELRLLFKQGFSLEFRAYDDGCAYRFITEFSDDIQINSEGINFDFPDNPNIYFPTEESFFTHSERLYEYLKIAEIPNDKYASLPTLIDREDGIKILITESHLEDYPGLYLAGNGANSAGLNGIFPPYVLEGELSRDRDIKPVKTADYIALTKGSRSFPWRVAAISIEDKELVSNDIVLRLAPKSRIEDASWIKPGRATWDWWNASNNVGVPFRSGVNTATYKYHIDFAADYGLEYLLMCEGWSNPSNLCESNPECDMDEIVSYAEEKGVGLILWVLWNVLDDDLDKALDRFEEWGIKGIKVDFMQRDDQAMVSYYWRIAEAAAQRKLLVDFHGSYKPAGIRGAYPNCVNREGVKGLENAKWSDWITPDHDCTIPFIRMVAGPIDYTPGAMRNAHKINYNFSYTRPMSQGTRCHQLALYVIFDSPLQMLCDAPANYYREPLAMEFLSVVPSVWDETIPLFGKVGDYIGVARQDGNDWYIGAITDSISRDFNIDLSFLPDGNYQLTEFVDGINADQFAEDFRKETSNVKPQDEISIHLAPGGGYAAILRKN